MSQNEGCELSPIFVTYEWDAVRNSNFPEFSVDSFNFLVIHKFPEFFFFDSLKCRMMKPSTKLLHRSIRKTFLLTRQDTRYAISNLSFANKKVFKCNNSPLNHQH